MKEVIEFLIQLAANNNRPWFQQHKEQYQQAKNCFDAFVEELIAEVRAFDPSIGPLTVADCTYRIYRDTRFSPDKTPYKTHFGAFIAPGGKKSPFAGYYLQIGADNSPCFPGGNMIATGDYMTDPKVLKIIREDMVLDSGEAFAEALKKARGFELDFSQSLKRVPPGLPADAPFSLWLKLKNYCLVKSFDHEFALRPDFARAAARQFKTTKPLLDLVNRAIALNLELGNE